MLVDSLPHNALDQIIRPCNGIVYILNDIETFRLIGIECLPTLTFDDLCRPRLGTPVEEKPLAYPSRFDEIDLAVFNHYLEVYEIMRPLAAVLRQSVKLLSNLVMQRHEGHGLRRRQSHFFEQLDDAFRQAHLSLVGISYFVVPNFQRNRQP